MRALPDYAHYRIKEIIIFRPTKKPKHAVVIEWSPHQCSSHTRRRLGSRASTTEMSNPDFPIVIDLTAAKNW